MTVLVRNGRTTDWTSFGPSEHASPSSPCSSPARGPTGPQEKQLLLLGFFEREQVT
jgi:hypothetical protein